MYFSVLQYFSTSSTKELTVWQAEQRLDQLHKVTQKLPLVVSKIIGFEREINQLESTLYCRVSTDYRRSIRGRLWGCYFIRFAYSQQEINQQRWEAQCATLKVIREHTISPCKTTLLTCMGPLKKNS